MKTNQLPSKLKSGLIYYIIGSGILFNLLFIFIIAYGFFKINQLGVSFETVANKAADKVSFQMPVLANLIRQYTQETDDDWIIDVANIDEWSIKGAASIDGLEERDDGIPNRNYKKIRVSNTKEFLNALEIVKAGQTIVLNPGVYKIKRRTINVGHAGTSDKPIFVTGDRLGVVTIELDTIEGFYIDKSFWVFENLKIKGVCSSDSNCEHAFHVVGRGNGVVVQNNIITDFNAAIKANGVKEGKDFYYPDNGLVKGNTFYNSTIRDTDNPVTVLDIVGVNDWVASDNFISDFVKGKGDKVSYAAFFKGNGFRNTFERNLIICRLNLKPESGAQVGLSFGGGGTSLSSCRNQQCDVENTSGVIRHNLVMNCDDVAIYLNKSKDVEIYNNTLINTLGIDVRFPQSSAVIANNFLTGRVKNRNGGSNQSMNNVVVDLDDVNKFFENPLIGDFTLKNRASVVGRGVDLQSKEKGFCGTMRGPENVDIGAFEYGVTNNICNPFRM